MNLLKLLEDLRFFIGAFFLIVGAMLVVQGVVNPVMIADLNPNLITGAGFLLFGAFAMTLAWLGYRKDRRSERDAKI